MGTRWLIAVLVLAGACVPGSGTPGPESPEGREDLEDQGFLVVDQAHVGGGFYTEGAFTFVLLETEEGRPVADRRYTDLRLTRPLLRMSLEPGSYRVETYLRGCNGSCGALDPPTSRCSAGFDLALGETVTALVELRPPDPCSIVFGRRVDGEFAYREGLAACAAFSEGPHRLPSWIREPPGKRASPRLVAKAYAQESFPDFERFVLAGAEAGCRDGLRGSTAKG